MAFHFRIENGRVSIAEKAPATPDKVPIWRPPLYQKFLTHVVESFCPDLTTDLLVHVGDGGLGNERVPILAFQKPHDTNPLLLPDVDLLEADFFEGPHTFDDQLVFFEKDTSAVFVGATSGMRIDEDVVRYLRLPRLRSAMFFKDNPRVDFRLPVLDNVVSDGAREMLVRMGFGLGNRLTYEEQLRHKFIISMDGFGATCSRVATSLMSNSVLLKYDSPHRLFYFHGLKEWIHYVPISEDRDVLTVIRMEEENRGLFALIAQQGQDFFRTYLVRSAAARYTALLLGLYAGLFHG